MNLSPQRDYIASVLAQAKSPCVLVSFGKDSQLLLALVREIQPDIPLYFFGDELTKFAEQFIIDHDLTVFNYAPADRYLIPNGDGLALVDECAMGRARIPLLTEVVKGNGCRHGVANARTSQVRWPYDTVLWGYKRDESMPAVGQTFGKEIPFGDFRLVAPLYELTDADVYEALETLGLDYDPEPDEVEFCDECLNAVINSDWDKDAALSGFRARFNFNH